MTRSITSTCGSTSQEQPYAQSATQTPLHVRTALWCTMLARNSLTPAIVLPSCLVLARNSIRPPHRHRHVLIVCLKSTHTHCCNLTGFGIVLMHLLIGLLRQAYMLRQLCVGSFAAAFSEITSYWHRASRIPQCGSWVIHLCARCMAASVGASTLHGYTYTDSQPHTVL